MIMPEELKIDKIIEKMELKLLTPDIETGDKVVTVPDINRPALQLTGFFDHFDSERVQVIGHVEAAYMETLDEETRKDRYEQLMSYNIPCIVFCRSMMPDAQMIEAAREYQIPLLQTDKATSSFEAEIIRWMKVMLAPTISIHGVLVDVYGEGVLITGESGIGKSEAALELIKRGHRLVTDDVVQISKVSDETLIGTAPSGMSIEQRPPGVSARSSFGHWEMDCVVGKRSSKNVLLVFTERLTRKELIYKIPDKTKSSVVKIIDKLQLRFGCSFTKIFKTITCDNGIEFVDSHGIQYDKSGNKRVDLYYCHPYTSCERGSNENQNRLIRKHYPKGCTFTRLTRSDIVRLENWINNYPRKLFGWRSSNDMFDAALKELGL